MTPMSSPGRHLYAPFCCRCSQAESILRERECRTDPVGVDRHGNLYFLFGTTQPRLFVVSSTDFTGRNSDGSASAHTGPARWRSYDDPVSFRRLLAFLSPKGKEEGQLLEVLLRHQVALEDAMVMDPRRDVTATQSDPLRFRPRCRVRNDGGLTGAAVACEADAALWRWVSVPRGFVRKQWPLYCSQILYLFMLVV